jgi:hypothetical protein
MTEAERQRLVRLLGMLGSAFDGEIANAGRMADTLARQLGGWEQVLGGDDGNTLMLLRRLRSENADLREQLDTARAVRRAGDDDDAKVELAFAFLHWLTPWEHQFIADMAKRSWPLTERQAPVSTASPRRSSAVCACKRRWPDEREDSLRHPLHPTHPTSPGGSYGYFYARVEPA